MLRDLWRRPVVLPPDASAALRDLDLIVQARPELASPAHVLALVISAVFSIEDAANERPDVARGIADSIFAGQHGGPILAAVFDRESVGRRGRAACDVLRAENRAADRLREALRADRHRIAQWGEWLLCNQEQAFAMDAAALGLDVSLALSIVRLSLLPGLTRVTFSLASTTGLSRWVDATCPFCGDLPCLAESRGLEGGRILRCGMCAGEWHAPRLGCVGCGEREPTKLRSIAVKGEESRRHLVRCESCGLSLKVVSTLSPLSAPGLLVAELAASPLDES